MLYLALFSTLALGFYASIVTAVNIASSERHTNQSLLAAESGMAFMKFHLANLGVPPDTLPDDLFNQVYTRLSSRLNTYGNMNGYTVGINTAADTITIPGPDNTWILSDTDPRGFRVIIKKQTGQQLQVNVIGGMVKRLADGSFSVYNLRTRTWDTNGGTSASARMMRLDYAIAKDAAKIFNFGVASKSAISMSGNVTVQGASSASMGSILSATTSTTTPLSMSGNSQISGDASFVLSSPTLSIGSNSMVAGLKPTDSGFTDHVHTGVDNVPFPLINTAAFMTYVPAKGTVGTQVISDKNPAGTYFKNIRIKAGTNPTFAAGTSIDGVVVVEYPNQVKFSGQVNITGVIVSETDNPTTDPNNASFDITKATLDFAGGVTFKGIDQLPATADFPAAERALTGSMVLAPGFQAGFGGNFGAIGGSIIASGVDFHGSAGGTVTGSVVNLQDSALTIAGTSTITIQSVGTNNYPAGVFFGEHYYPLPDTYKEGVYQ
jgi:hypothetical protein